MSAAKIASGAASVEPACSGLPTAGALRTRLRALGQPEGRTLVRQLSQLCDAAAILSSYALSYYLHDILFARIYPPMQPLREYVWMLWLIVPFWLSSMRWAGLYEAGCYRSFPVLFRRLFNAQVIAGMLMLSFLFVSRFWNVSRLFTQVFIAVSFVGLSAERSLLKLVMDRSSLSFVAHLPRVLVIGDGRQADDYAAFIRERSYLMRDIVGCLGPDASAAMARDCQTLGSVRDLAQILTQQVVDEVIIVSPSLVNDEQLAKTCLVRGVTVRFVVRTPAAALGITAADDLGDGVYQFSIAATPHRFLPLIAKRIIDIAGALIGLPICALLALWYWPRLRRESPGPLLFRQTRVGQNGRHFTLYKFRTMHPGADGLLADLAPYNEMNGQVFKMRDDPRVTPSGKIARRFHLDEFPQFWNVLKGDMSLVGTRPPTVDEVCRYDFHHHRRISAKPGMTGLSQLQQGHSLADFEDIVRLDCQYIDHWSLWMDIWVLLKTIAKVFEGSAC